METTRPSGAASTVRTTPTPPPVVGRRLPEAERYVLLEEIGAGAMGVVFAAYDTELDRKVALKLLPAHLLGSAHHDQLRREAQALAQLSHPNVVSVHDVAETGGRMCVVMEFVRGRDVAAWASDPRSIEAIVDVVRAAATGLAAAHAIDLVHRDVKPSNLLIGDDGRVRVADFGLARPGVAAPGGADAAPGDATSSFAGSPAYMPPEQLRGRAGDARADQFALCVTLYELLFGRLPFAGDTLAAHCDAIAAGMPAGDRVVPRWLSTALARGLAAAPEDRFADLTALCAALAPPRRSRAVVAGGAAAIIAVVGVAGALLYARHERSAAAEPGAVCAADASQLQAAWSPARRAGLVTQRHDPADPGASARLATQLDAYADGWQRQRLATCRAAHVEHRWTADVEARAAQCLQSRQVGFERALDALAAPGDALSADAASQLVSELRSTGPCADPDYLRSAIELAQAPAARATAIALDTELGILALARVLGHDAEVAHALPRLRARIDAAGYAPGQAQLAMTEGDLARERGELPEAVRWHTEAYVRARQARSPVAATQAATSLVWDLGLAGEELDRASDWARIALAESAPLEEQEVGISVHYALGALADRRGDLAGATREFTRAVELSAREHGAEHLYTAMMNSALSAVLGAAGRFREAIEPHRAALAIMERWRGPEARMLIRPLMNLALTESSAGLHADAEAHARRSVALAQKFAEPERLGSALQNLGAVLLDAARSAEALPYFEQAVAQFEQAKLPAAAALARVQRSAAAMSAAVVAGDARALARLRDDVRTARAVLASADGEDSATAADADVVLAPLLAALGACDEARAIQARARAAYLKAEAPAPQRAKAELPLVCAERRR